mgnify:CR=1 FL=1
MPQVNGLVQFFRGLGTTRLLMMAGVCAALIAFFLFITLRLAAPKMTLLYTDLDMGDSAKIVAKLQSMSIPYQLSDDSSTILVPSNRVLELRMNIAQENLIGGGSVGYELFDRTDALGTTSFVQNVNHVRALEGELARTIRSIDSIVSARVHLVLPQRQLFSRDERQPSASIAIKTRGATLTPGQIRAIQNLVASAVPDLQADRVSIIDHRGALLAKGVGSSDDLLATSLEEKRVAQERRLREQVEALLERTVGLGKVRAEVAVEMDLSRVTTNSQIYDPDGQVARSTVTVEDVSNDLESSRNQSVTIANNLPDADQYAGGDQLSNQSSSQRIEETVNYEISQTVRTEVHEAGTIRRLSIAVLVDGLYSEGPDGQLTYTPRSDEEIAKLTALVKSAVGFNAERGDSVEVINMRFADVLGSEAAPIEISVLGFRKDDLFRMAEIFVLGLVGILVIFLVLRPLITRLAATPPAPGGGLLTDMTGGMMQPALAAPEGAMLPALPTASADGVPQIPVDETGRPLTARQIAERGGIDTAIEVASIEGRVQGSALKKVGELIDRNPEEATSVVRNWLYGN